jgi:hypothetical protein
LGLSGGHRVQQRVGVIVCGDQDGGLHFRLL